MNPLLRGSYALALALLLSAGCAGAPSKDDPPSVPPTMAPPRPGVVLTYEPKSLAETAEIVWLAREEIRMRPFIEQAQEAAMRAIEAYQAAARSLKAPPEAPISVRPTQEQVDALYKVAVEKVARYRAMIQWVSDRYEAFLKKYPDNWYQRHRYAWFLADNQLADDAAEQWRRVIAQAPTFPYAYNNLGTLYNHMGRDLEAILLYRKAIELYPDDADFYENLAVNYSTHRAEASKEFGWDLPRVFRECILAYQHARDLSPKDTEIAYDLATQYILAKYFGLTDTADEAIEAWKYYLALDLTPSQRAIADRNMATIYLRQKNDPATAQKLIEEALTLMPNDSTCKVILDQCKAAMGKK
jgi:tetratricopeptide (TPR) repeat protein